MPYTSYSDQQQYVPQAELAAADSQRANDTIGAQNQVLRMRLDQMLRREAALEASRTKAKFAHDQAVQGQANAMQRLTVGAGARQKLADQTQAGLNSRAKASEAAKAKKNADDSEMKRAQMEQQDRQHREDSDGLKQRGQETARRTDALLANKLVDSATKTRAAANRERAKTAGERLDADDKLSEQYLGRINKLYASLADAYGKDAPVTINAEIASQRAEMSKKLLSKDARDELVGIVTKAQDDNDVLWNAYGVPLSTTQPAIATNQQTSPSIQPASPSSTSQPVATSQPVQPQQPTTQPSLTMEQTKAILKEAGGDKEKARKLARSRGYSFNG